jgi:hypothetical protein
MGDLLNLKQRQERIAPQQVLAAAGAIVIKEGVVWITGASALAITLAAPAVDDDGKVLHIRSTTAQAHTLTVAGGLNGAGSGADVGTFGGAIGDGVTLAAHNGAWRGLHNINVTFA